MTTKRRMEIQKIWADKNMTSGVSVIVYLSREGGGGGGVGHVKR